MPIENESGDNAILIRGRAAGQCWDNAATGPDIPYVDAMFTDTESRLCVDTGRRFAAGYSSGSFTTHVLGCTHGDMLRGVASIAGGQTGSKCTGNVAALLIHDADDTTVNISQSVSARDAYLTRNGCDVNAARTPFDPSPCESYAGCPAALPVVWCQTSGQGHSRQDGLAAPAFWHFFSGLGAR